MRRRSRSRWAASLSLMLLVSGAHPVAAQPDAAASAGAEPWPGGEEEVYTETIPGSVVSFEMVAIPGGSTTVVTPQGPETVAVAPFWMGRLEVTWDMYDIFVYGLKQNGAGTSTADAITRPSKPYVLPGETFGHQGRPALAMSFHAAQEFARWLSAVTGKRYRLPTEVEWESACRANSSAPPADLAEHAWYWDNSDAMTHPGDQRKRNAFGLGDMLGNVAEWVVGVDGEAVVKGGSFRDDLEDVHCGARRKQTPGWNATDPQLPKSVWWLTDAPFVGFRLVRDM